MQDQVEARDGFIARYGWLQCVSDPCIKPARPAPLNRHRVQVEHSNVHSQPVAERFGKVSLPAPHIHDDTLRVKERRYQFLKVRNLLRDEQLVIEGLDLSRRKQNLG